MARVISTDAVINSIRLAEQAGDVATIAAGYWQLYAKETGLFLEDDAEIVGGPLGTGLIPGGRLTLTTATPVTTADVNSAGTVYYTPCISNMIELFDGARWIPKTFAELSLDITAYTASKPYDIWAYLNAGAVALDSTVWTDGTTRATALTYQNGRLVKSGATDRRYLGTIYVDSDQRTDDSLVKRFVWNYYNRKERKLLKADATGHNYTTASWRAWNNDVAQRYELMVGVVEDPVTVSMWGFIDSSADAVTGYIGASLDSTTTENIDATSESSVAQRETVFNQDLVVLSSPGYHYVQAIELGNTTLTFATYKLRGSVMG